MVCLHKYYRITEKKKLTLLSELNGRHEVMLMVNERPHRGGDAEAESREMVEYCQVRSMERKHVPPILNKKRGKRLYKYLSTQLETSINIPSSWSLLESLSPPQLMKRLVLYACRLMLIGSKMDTLPNTWLLSNQSDGLQRT